MKCAFELRVDKASVAPGGQLTATIVANIKPGWHMYSTTQGAGGPVPTTIKLDSGPAFRAAGALQSPTPRKFFDENFGIETESYEGRVEFHLPVQAVDTAPAGKQKLTVKVRYMLCSDTLCLPPQTISLSADVAVSGQQAAGGGQQAAVSGQGANSAQSAVRSAPQVPGSGQREVRSAPQAPGSGQSAVRSAPQAPGSAQREVRSAEPAAAQTGPLGTMAYIWFSMAMGGLALLTPCVFPMIPITVSYFTKRQAVSRKQAVGRSFSLFGRDCPDLHADRLWFDLHLRRGRDQPSGCQPRSSMP